MVQASPSCQSCQCGGDAGRAAESVAMPVAQAEEVHQGPGQVVEDPCPCPCHLAEVRLEGSLRDREGHLPMGLEKEGT